MNGKGQSRYGAQKHVSEFNSTREPADHKENLHPQDMFAEAASKARVQRSGLVRMEEADKSTLRAQKPVITSHGDFRDKYNSNI